MKTVCVLGSPRPGGNSNFIAQNFCDMIEKRGSEVQTFTLNKLSYRGCQGCMTCKTKLERCAIEDDLTVVLESIRTADVLVMATPIYFSDVTSQIKGFIDRTYSFLVSDFRTNPHKSRLPEGKKLVFIQVQARPDKHKFSDVFPRYEEFFVWYGFRERYLIRCCGVRELGEIKTRNEIIPETEEVVKKIMGVRD